MEHWLIVLLVIIGVVAAIFLLAWLTSSIVLWAANRFLKKQEKERKKRIIGLLPGTDCAECGFASCRLYAKEWAVKKEDPGKCPFMTEEGREQVLGLIKAQEEFLEQRISTRAKDDGFLKKHLYRDNPPEE